MMMPGARRLRHVIVFGGLVAVMAAAVIFAKSGCDPGASFWAGGDPWVTYLVSALFVFMGWGTLALHLLGRAFAKLGWEPDYQGIKFTHEHNDEELKLTPVVRRLFAYPMFASVGAVGLWLWTGINGCDVIVVPMRGIAA